MSLLDKANFYYQQKFFSIALDTYKVLAKDGNYGCARRLGWMYFQGEGCDIDKTEAIKWFRQASKVGDAAADFGIGIVYASLENWIVAQKWFELSARKNFAPSIYRLAWIEAKVNKDNIEGIKNLLIKASELGNIRAKRDLGILYFSREVGLKAKFLACYYLVQCVASGIVIAMKDRKDIRLLF